MHAKSFGLRFSKIGRNLTIARICSMETGVT